MWYKIHLNSINKLDDKLCEIKGSMSNIITQLDSVGYRALGTEFEVIANNIDEILMKLDIERMKIEKFRVLLKKLSHDINKQKKLALVI